MKKQHKTFADIVGDFANAPYNEKGHGQDGVVGFSCLGLCHAFMKKMGKDWPDTYEGMTLDNYQETIQTRSPEARAKLLELINSIGVNVPVFGKVAGDFILIRRGTDIYPAIYVGNGQIMASFLYCGVKVTTLAKEENVIAVRRL